MDNHTARAYAIAEALLSGWRVQKIAVHERLIEFSRLWIRPGAARGSRWSIVINTFIDQRYRSARQTRAAVLLLKPFPLEYEGVICEGGPVAKAAFISRQAAMQRLYAKTLGAQKLYDGKWMWLPMRPGTPPPRKRRRR